MYRRAAGWFSGFFSQKAGADAMLRRELIADVVQNSFKATAFWLSGSQAMKAELMRAAVDCVNHVTLYWVNTYSKRPPDAKHNYGYERMQNLVAFLPSTLFLCSGVYNVISPVHNMWAAASEPTLTLTIPALAAITLCSVGEFYLFYKNLGDIETYPGHNVFVQFFKRGVLAIKVLSRLHPADPIQVVVVSENVTAVLGMSLPLLTSFVTYFTGLTFLDEVGCILNGSVQLYLAWSICWDNTQVLMGKSLSKVETLVRIR